jgi:hypothetical protein
MKKNSKSAALPVAEPAPLAPDTIPEPVETLEERKDRFAIEAAKNKSAYWAAYRRALTNSPLLVMPSRAAALMKGYADGLAERAKRYRAALSAEASAKAEQTADAVTA